MTGSAAGAMTGFGNNPIGSLDPMSVGRDKDDFKTKSIKKALIDDVKGALVAERLQCKPIHGHDLPLSAVQSHTQNRVGTGGA